jgi:hypothetical protein
VPQNADLGDPSFAVLEFSSAGLYVDDRKQSP